MPEPVYTEDRVRLYLGDCVEVMAALPAASVDAIVTDPPYFLTNDSGAGFMGRAWDSLSPAVAAVVAVFKSSHLVFDGAEGATVVGPASTPPANHGRASNAQFAAGDSPAVDRIENQSTSSAPVLVITKDEALDLCGEWLSDHIAVVAALPDRVRFVAPRSWMELPRGSIARVIANTWHAEPAWLAHATIFTSTASIGNRPTVVQSGPSPATPYSSGTSGAVEPADDDAVKRSFNAITSSPTDSRETIARIISSPFVSRVIRACISVQNSIQLLSESRHSVWAVEALRVLKPGGHLLAFGGTRTHHRLMCALEDAGFEIRDCLMWLHGQGFPKSKNSGDGWGTALKPAWEPIILARRPLGESTVAGNVLRYGTGAINVDACRIGMGADKWCSSAPSRRKMYERSEGFLASQPVMPVEVALGRWPANLVLDAEAARQLDAQSGERPAGGHPNKRGDDGDRHVFGRYAGGVNERIGVQNTTGGASRFFYTSKADADDRDGSRHPTIKPLDLCKWLVTLVTPPGGIVLDPFMGSGTIVQAARDLGFTGWGIDREAEYVEDAKRRLRQGSLL
jgi:DNA modification methylase